MYRGQRIHYQRQRFVWVGVVLSLCLGLGSMGGSFAKPRKKRKSRKEKKRHLWKKKLRTWKRTWQLRKIRRQEGALLDSLAELDRQRLGVMAQMQVLEEEYRTQKKVLEQAEQNAKMQEEICRAMRKKMRPRLRLFYRINRLGQARFLLGTKSLRALGERWRWLRMLATHDLRLLQEYKKVRDLAQASAKQVSVKKKKLQASMKALEKERAVFVRLRKEKQVALGSLYKEVRLLKRTLKTVQGDRRAFRRLLSGVGVPLAARGLARKKGRLPWPIRGFSPFCQRYFLKWIGSFAALSCEAWKKKAVSLRGPLGRTGLSLSVPEGTPVVAIARGRVAHQGWMRGYGKIMLLEHGARYYTLYAHLSKFGPKRGESILAGQMIGLSGSTGLLGKPALYFEIRHMARSLKPEGWLKTIEPPL